MKHPIQIKEVGEGKPDPPPGGFVQAFLNAWQNSRGWTGIWLYLDALKITTEVRTAEVEHTRNSAEVGIAALEQTDHACLRALL